MIRQPEEPADQHHPEDREEVVAVGAGDVGADALSMPGELPLLTIREAVAFPGVVMPLEIGREKSKHLVDDALNADKLLGVVAQRRAAVEDPSLDDLFQTLLHNLTTARIRIKEAHVFTPPKVAQ